MAATAPRQPADAATALLEVGELGVSMRERLIRAAARLSCGEAAPVHRAFDLRHDQGLVFRNFADYLSDRATGVAPGSFCRIVLPPRTGKTVLAGHVIGRSGLTATVVVPTRTLAQQTCRLLDDMLPGVPVGALTGEERRVVDHGVNVTTYAMLQRLGSEGLPAPLRQAGLVFVDEAHRAMTAARMKLLRDAFDPAALRVGLTATPDYDSERRLGRFFPDLIHDLSLGEAFGLGLLAPVRVWVAEVDHAGSSVRMAAGEYDRETLGRLMSSAPFFKATEAFRYAGVNREKAALICCATRQQAHDLCQFLIVHRPAGSAAPALLLGETSRADRDRALTDFEAGAIDTLVQVGVLIEGWSSSRCKVLIDLAPSVSRVRAAQKYFRPMTRDGAAQAHIYVLLPTRLPALPTLPTDLFSIPAGSYLCGEILGDAPGVPGGGPGVVTGMRTPIAGVRLRQRILLSAILRSPALRRDDRAGIERVLSTCGDFDAADPPSRHRFRALLFQHSLFTGRGEALLEWLGYPMTSTGYEQFLLRACPEAAATRMLAERGLGEYSVVDEPCSSDVQALKSERFADPSSVMWPAGRHADVGLGGWGVAATTPPFDRLLAQENATLLRELLFDLTPRRITILERRFGLHGEERRTLDQIAGEEEVTRERIRGIEACALRRLRLSMGQRLLSDRSLDEERPIAPRRDRLPLVYRLPEPRPSRRDRSWMSTVYAALAEASAACSTSELAGRLRAPRADVARGLRGLARAGRVTATDDGYLAVGSSSPRAG